MNRERILVISHAHPDFSLGGGEIAAYNLFKAYKQSEKVESAWFLARADRGRGPTGLISKRRDNEYLWEQAIHDWHSMKAVHTDSVTTWFADLIKALKPTVVHTHHYAYLGLEYLQVIKQVDPRIKIMLTLHEYMAICANNGQMVKTGSFKLCNQSSPDDCHRCFPEKSAEDFWLRKHRFMRYFDLVDQFISPSNFLRQRYIDWGLPLEKIAVIENGQSDEPPLPPRVIEEGETRNRFGFFGQINPYKGLDVLLEAINLMSKADRKNIVLEIHGANLELQPKEYQEKIQRLLKPLQKQGVVQWIGPYQPHELRSRMTNIDWVCVPSIWWENSPMIIQEAFSCGRPLLVSDIGGMAEKIMHNITGHHVSARKALEWMSKLNKVTNSQTWDILRQQIEQPLNHMQVCEMHIHALRL